MQNNNESNKNKSAEPTSAKKETYFAIFSQEEIRTIVKEFLKAYIGGQLEINYQTADEIMTITKLEKRPIDFATAYDMEIKVKTSFADTMHICLGTKEVSDEEKRHAMNEMIDFILSVRSSKRLKGQFLTFNVEKQIGELKEDLDMTNKLVNQILLSLRSGVTKI